MTECCCQKPEKLKTVPEECGKEQIEKCHGQVKDHTCCGHDKTEKD